MGRSRRRLRKAVLAEIRRAILGGNMPPGSQIFQDELATEFGVSRIPVPDALRLLEGEGLVIYAAHRGHHVAQLDVEEMLEIQHIREILETEALSHGVSGITEETVDTMAAALDQMAAFEAENDLVSWVAVHRRFHFVMFEAAAMPYLMRVLGQIWDASDLYRSHYMTTDSARRRARAEHASILRACRGRDLEELLELMHTHREATVASIRRSLVDDPPG